MDDVEEEVQYYFDKKFTFTPSDKRWELVPPEKMFKSSKWEIPQMLKYKEELNARKDQLNDFNLEQWHKHTRTTNPSGNVVWTLKKLIKPEMVSQAWCKFFEVCSSYPIISDLAVEQGFLNSVHLCEAPGSFITALNHFLKLNYPQLRWDWFATTFNPYYEENQLSTMIPNDQFILLTLDKWEFGPDQTGNIMDLENLKTLVARSKSLGPILLATADGSIDCQDQPAEQEELVAPLLFCEVVAGLHILSIGGTFIVKTFTMYENPTICLMYLLNACFEAVHVFKPVTSREGNSETYVICINYDGTEERKIWLRQLRSYYGPNLPQESMFPLLKIPETFIDQLLVCAEKFKNYQDEVLERNIVLFNIELNTTMSKIKILKHRVAEVYLEKYKLRPLATDADEVVGTTKLAKVIPLQSDPRCDDGTFNEKRRRELLPSHEKLRLLLKDVRRFIVQWGGNTVRWMKFPQRSLQFQIVKGKPVNTIRTSKFCRGSLLKLQQQVDALISEIECLTIQEDWEVTCNVLSNEVKSSITLTESEFLRENCQVLNFDERLTSANCRGRNQEIERKAILKIFEMLENAWRDVNLVIEGFPLLSQLSTGFVFMLGHLFDEIGFLRPNGNSYAILFRGFRSRDRALASFMDQLLHEADQKPLSDVNTAVLSIIPINLIIENYEFYETVVTWNMMAIKNGLEARISNTLQHTFDHSP